MSWAVVSVKSRRATASVSPEWMRTMSPRISTSPRPESRGATSLRRRATSPGWCRPDARALTSAAVPSATIRPLLMKTTRSA